MHFTELIRSWLGWCPHRMAPFRKETFPWPDMNSQSLPVKDAYIRGGIIVDYGKTGISLPYFIAAMIGILGITAFLLLIVRIKFLFLAGIPFWVLMLSVAIVMVYRDLKRATLEITQDTLIIRRSLHRPVIIPRDTISAFEIRPNVQPFPLWLQKTLFLFVLPVLSAGLLYDRYLQFAAGEITSLSLFLQIGFNTSIVLFFLASYYHSLIRADYPEILVITTTTKKLAGMYGTNPEEIVKRLGKSA